MRRHLTHELFCKPHTLKRMFILPLLFGMVAFLKFQDPEDSSTIVMGKILGGVMAGLCAAFFMEYLIQKVRSQYPAVRHLWLVPYEPVPISALPAPVPPEALPMQDPLLNPNDPNQVLAIAMNDL